MKETEDNLRVELDASLRFETLLADLSASFVNLPSVQVDQVLEEAQRRVCECFAIDRCTLWCRSEGPPETIRCTHFHQRTGPPRVKVGMDLGGLFPWFLERVRDGATVVFSRLDDLPPEAALDKEILREHGVKAGVVVPLSADGKVLDGLNFGLMREERVWPETLVKRLELAARVFTHVLVCKQAEKALQESETKYRRLYESMMDAFVSVDMAGNLREFNPAYSQMLGYTDEELHRMTYMDLTPKKWHALEASLIREQILKRGYSNVYEKEYRKKDGTVFPVELRIFLITDPGGEPIGMWAIVRDITGRKAMEEAQREFSHRLWLAQDEARRRIARELHDSTAQNLAAAAMNLTLLKDEMSGNKALKLLHDSLALVQECTQQVSTLSYLLHPPLLDDLGLIPALRSYVQGFAQRSGIQVTMDLPKELGRLPQEVELTLFRVVQEGLGNIHRHSGSPTAQIGLTCDSAWISLKVSDSGRGIPAETLRAFQQGRAGLGVGLAGMRERLGQLMGRVEIESSERGTTLLAVVPLPQGQL